ncbi:isoprenylcysteine carboxylmethyltransferase family protein [Kibdelosporangium philippinense]|uniref:Isoprenylcysteine carboxylmethyltransferase family protein n=1 Tax=Kibdelosporangium philippinense TaxID=211113 RepID=A0ABS8ZK14_9PSEU|nr:isoprenylcysteine carboxylmethyltransferase family protein [Kibdelosporangium philippinense]MCE7008075.1 isoprenylcysteine carboxylmethyltransferase family protein [Kibdelosporangium philippinense]
MTFLALGIYLLWLILAFGVPITAMRRRTGGQDTGMRISGPLQWSCEAAFGLIGLVGLANPILDLFDVLARIAVLDQLPLRIVGAVIAAAGVAGTLYAQLFMGPSWRIGVDTTERTDLVTSGPFGVVRNPIFASMLLTGLGLALAVPNFLSFGGLVMLYANVSVLVRRVEEPYLIATHGAAYLDYARRVGRFIPGLGRLN